MTLGQRNLKRLNSPIKSPKLANSSLRKKALLRTLSNGVQFGAASKANLKVVVRVRPENQREIESNAKSVIDIVDDHMLIFDPDKDEEDFFFKGEKQKYRDLNKRPHKEQKFVFEKVYGPSSTNTEIFETTTKDIVNTILEGYNCSVFAYGATGSGKTHTMIGGEQHPGLAFLTVMELYDQIGKLKDTRVCEVGVSYLEVYNEMVRDLLNPRNPPLTLRETGQHVQVTGLSFHKPADAQDLLRILAEGNRNRSQHPTDANAESSRSHAVFQVFVRQQDRSSDIKSSVSIAKLSMIDLAGSERGAATGFRGARFREGANINKSLLALGNCINALADGKGHIPYRDSKLTRLLKDSIGGNCRSVMIATISKTSLTFEDTFNTLRYANRAKTIKTTLKKNLMNVDQHVSQYLKVVEDLKREISELKERLKTYEVEAAKSPKPLAVSLNADEKNMYEETIQALRMQLEEKTSMEKQKSQIEKELLDDLMELKCLHKNYQRELLQLETTERELEMKIYVNRVYIVRIRVFAFASNKLDKGITRCERSIQAFEGHLQHIRRRKQFLNEKLVGTKERILALCEQFKEKVVPDCDQYPEVLINSLKQIELEQNLRDEHQINEYLRSLVGSLMGNQLKTEKLLALLLVALKHAYLRQKVTKDHDPDTDDFLEKIYEMLDTSRIEWADLKDTEESFGEQTVSQYISLPPMMNIDKLTNFPVMPTIDFSPAIFQPAKMYKRSSMKVRPASSTTRFSPDCMTPEGQLLKPVSRKILNLSEGAVQKSETELESRSSVQPPPPPPPQSPSSSSQQSHINLQITTSEVAPESANDSEEVPSTALARATPISARLCTTPLSPSPSIKDTSLPNNVKAISTSIVDSSCYPLNTTVNMYCNNPTDIASKPSSLKKSSPIPQVTKKPSPIPEVSEVEQSLETSDVCLHVGNVSNVSPLPVTPPCAAEPCFSLSSSHSEMNRTITLSSNGNSICDPPSSALQPIKEESSLLCPDMNLTITLSGDGVCPTPSSSQPDKKDSSLVNDVVNSTFSLSIPDAMETFIIPEDDSNTNTNSKVVLQQLPSSAVKNRENLPTNKMLSKKNGHSMISSKYSFSKLPSNSFRSSSGKGFSRSISSSALPNSHAVKNGPPNSASKATMKKSFSFLKPRSGSTSKNQENVAPKTVAFGSTAYLNTHLGASSKRVLHFSSSSSVGQ